MAHIVIANMRAVGDRVIAAMNPTPTSRAITHCIEIDDKLMRDALRATAATTKRDAVALGLRTLVDSRRQEQARRLRGEVTWDGDSGALRTDK